ncbi:hypothetical protein CAPTEDRAFT_33932, partial [Capitella teleta]
GKNVLFITIDDLRPELGFYTGERSIHPDMHTPNIDALASRSLQLRNNYVQQALCGPSRTSFLTGRRPDTTRVHSNSLYFREVAGNFTTLPQYFKNHGYHSLGMGKVFHPGSSSGDDDPLSWSQEFYKPEFCSWLEYEQCVWPVTAKETEDCPLPDVGTADEAIRSLQRFAPGGEMDGTNFFMAVGFMKPHLPFIFPEEFLDLYPEEEISLPTNPFVPSEYPEVAWGNPQLLLRCGDVTPLNFTGAANETLPEWKQLELRRAYYASVSFVDHQLGRVLDELDRLGMRDNTLVSLLGDHGFKIGEHGGWGKFCNFDLSVHAPLMVSVPGDTDHGVISNSLTELVDLYPTLVDAADLPPITLCPEDSSDVDVCTEGASLIPLVADPEAELKSKVFSQYPRERDTVMGYSMRTRRYRYTEWPSFDAVTMTPDWNELHGVELYDHENDPDENQNVWNDS